MSHYQLIYLAEILN